MTSPTRLVWDLAGQPPPTGSASRLLKMDLGHCCVCGAVEDVTADVNRALGANFTDRTMYRGPGTDRVCAACLWCCSGKPPATLRMWSIAASPGLDIGPSQPKAWIQETPGLMLTSRAQTTPITDILASPPAGDWVVSIATSGQKHVLPYTHVNHGRDGPWRVRMETVTVASTPRDWRHVHEHAKALRRLGVPPEHVRDGTPRYLKTRGDLATWKRHNDELRPWHRSPLLDLALWTITKGTLT